MLFDNNDFNNTIDYTFLDLAGLTNDMNSSINNQNSNLYSSNEGFLRGNMFKDEYKPYKNLTFVKIEPKSNREAKLYTVIQYSFAINDLNLYLDLHPNDTKMVNLLKEFIKLEKKAKEEYEDMYGALEVCDTKGNSFDYVNSPWSWEKDNGGGMYV